MQYTFIINPNLFSNNTGSASNLLMSIPSLFSYPLYHHHSVHYSYTIITQDIIVLITLNSCINLSDYILNIIYIIHIYIIYHIKKQLLKLPFNCSYLSMAPVAFSSIKLIWLVITCICPSAQIWKQRFPLRL